MNMSDNGVAFLVRLEGKRNRMYYDSKGLATTGVGHLIGGDIQLMTKVLTDDEVEELLKQDLAKFEHCVNSSVTGYLSQSQFDALVSLCFNIGCGGFKGSTALRLVNIGEIDKVPNAILMWNIPHEIVGRRQMEANLFQYGVYA